jgi:dolichyl-phosphate-mannose-protein mannosyltransferase
MTSLVSRALGSAPVRIFLWSRTAIWVGALFALFVFDPNRGPYAARLDVRRLTHDLGAVTDVWARWDSIPYLQIAEHGYGGAKGSPAFYPLYPWTVGGVGRLLDGHYVLAAILVSLAATLVAFLLLHRLGRLKLGRDDATVAVTFLAVFPMSLFLQAIYAESLLLALFLAAFLAAERGRWATAGILAGLACLTRPTGFALLPALAVLAWSAPRRAIAWARVAAGSALFVLYPIILHFQLHSATAFLRSERFWHREVSPLGPLAGIRDGLRAAWAGVLQLTVGSQKHWYWTPVNPARAAALNLEYLVYLIVFCVLGVVAWRTLGAAYGVLVGVGLAIPLSAPSDTYPLLSLPRLGLVLFPIYLALAVIGRRPEVRTALLSTSAVLLGVSIAQWATWQWVS